jgi:hypothetical protein
MMKLGENGLSGTSKRLFDAVNINTSNKQLEIICDGDSWVFGCEIADPKIAARYDPSTHPGSYDFLEENDVYRIPKIFSTHLSKLLDAKVTNLSWPADDNGTILRRTIDYISTEYLATGKSTENLFVIVGWSSPERNSFWYKDDEMSLPFRLWPQVPHFNSPVQKKVWELYVAYMWHAEEYMPRYVHNVVQLQNFCNQHNIKWMCFNSFYQNPNRQVEDWQDLNIKDELNKIYGTQGYMTQSSDDPLRRKSYAMNYANLWDTVDPVRFYKKDQKTSTFKSYIDSHVDEIKNVYCGWHPSPESHEAWAHELVRYIKENNLI